MARELKGDFVKRDGTHSDTYREADTDDRTLSRFGVERYAMLDLWMALGGVSQEFETWIDEPRRTHADAWSQLVAAVRGDASGDTNPPAGDVLEAMARRRVRASDVIDLIARLRKPWVAGNTDYGKGVLGVLEAAESEINQLAGKAET